jgi:hypothetical protein
MYITASFSTIARWQVWGRNPSSSGSRTKAKASSREMQRGVEEGENLLSAQEVPPWHGEAMPAQPRCHQVRGRRRRLVGKAHHPPTPDLAKGKGQAARGEARGRHGRNPRCGRRRSQEHREPIDKISRTGRCAVAGSIECAPSRRLAPAGAVRIERGGGNGNSVARARERREEGGRCVDWPGWVDRATWSGSTRQAGADRWARGATSGPRLSAGFCI